MACKSKDRGGLEILNLTKFSSALRMRLLWHEWNEEAKPWVSHGNPCTLQDHDLSAAATMVTTGDRKKALFWEALWLNGMRPKDIAPLFFTAQKGENSHLAKRKTMSLGDPNQC
jgi:hypothetical protein